MKKSLYGEGLKLLRWDTAFKHEGEGTQGAQHLLSARVSHGLHVCLHPSIRRSCHSHVNNVDLTFGLFCGLHRAHSYWPPRYRSLSDVKTEQTAFIVKPS